MSENIHIQLDEELSIEVKTGEDYPEGGNRLCLVDIQFDDESIATVNSPSKPWENFTRAMARNIIVKRIEKYDSTEEVDELMKAGFHAEREELDSVFGWEEKPL